MLSRRIVSQIPKIQLRLLTGPSKSGLKQLQNYIVKNDVEIFQKIILTTTVIGGIGGGCNGIYIGYKWNRRESYVDCIKNTVYDFFGYTCIGLYCGFFTGILTPILIPLFCISAPVACGVGIVKYFDKK